MLCFGTMRKLFDTSSSARHWCLGPGFVHSHSDTLTKKAVIRSVVRWLSSSRVCEMVKTSRGQGSEHSELQYCVWNMQSEESNMTRSKGRFRVFMRMHRYSKGRFRVLMRMHRYSIIYTHLQLSPSSHRSVQMPCLHVWHSTRAYKLSNSQQLGTRLQDVHLQNFYNHCRFSPFQTVR